MRSKNILDEISDGKLYDIGDMVKADTGGCTGCSDCCKDVGDLVVLTPFDVNEIVNFLGVSFDELLGDKIVLRETNKISLPYLKMQDKNKYCSFLNKEGKPLSLKRSETGISNAAAILSIVSAEGKRSLASMSPI